MQVATFEMNKAEAKEKYLELLQERNPSSLNKARRRAYYALSKGQKIIDIYTAFEQAGLNELGQPRIAICRADMETCRFRPLRIWRNGSFTNVGGGSFMGDIRTRSKKEPVRLQEGTFRGLTDQTLTCPVPRVPQEHMQKGALHNYYILWEVEHWTEEPSKDPLLLRRLSKNMFEILAEWDLSDLEWSIARGAI